MGGVGGDHHQGEGDFRTKVWSMTGGPYCRAKHWKRNTAIAMFGIFLACIPIAMISAELEQRPHSLDSFSFGAKILERENIDMLQGESLPTRLFITGDTWHFHPQWPYLEACFSVYLSCFSVLYSFFVWFFALLSSIVFCCTVALLLLKKRGILTCLGLQNLLWFELCFCCFHMTKKLFSFP